MFDDEGGGEHGNGDNTEDATLSAAFARLSDFYDRMDALRAAFQRADHLEAARLAHEVFYRFPSFYHDTLRLARSVLRPVKRVVKTVKKSNLYPTKKPPGRRLTQGH